MPPTSTHTTAKRYDVERIDPFTLWCAACGRKLVRLGQIYMCPCGAHRPATLGDLPGPQPGSMWRHTSAGWIGKIEKIEAAMFGDELWLEVIAAMDTRLLGRSVWCSVAFLRDRCEPYDPKGGFR